MDPNVSIYLDVLARNAGAAGRASERLGRRMDRSTEMDFTRERDMAARQFSAEETAGQREFTRERDRAQESFVRERDAARAAQENTTNSAAYRQARQAEEMALIEARRLSDEQEMQTRQRLQIEDDLLARLPTSQKAKARRLMQEIQRPTIPFANELEREEYIAQREQEYTDLLETASQMEDPQAMLQRQFQQNIVTDPRSGRRYFFTPGRPPEPMDEGAEADPNVLDPKTISTIRQTAIQNVNKMIEASETIRTLTPQERAKLYADEFAALQSAFAPQQPAAPGQAPLTPPTPVDPVDMELQAYEQILQRLDAIGSKTKNRKEQP